MITLDRFISDTYERYHKLCKIHDETPLIESGEVASRLFHIIQADKTFGTKEFVSDARFPGITELSNRAMQANRDERGLKYMQSVCAVSQFMQFQQVYCIDNDFEKTLVETKKLRVYPMTITRVPYHSFYLDLTMVKRNVATGVFVTVLNTKDGVEIHTVTLFPDTFITDIYGIKYRECKVENGIIYKDVNLSEYQMFRSEDFDELSEIEKQLYRVKNKDEFICTCCNIVQNDIRPLVLQILSYLSLDEADVEPNTKQMNRERKIYEKAHKPYKKHISNVGFYYGETLRLIEKERNQTYESRTGESKSAPRAHTVSAHWHHYWTGSGRKTLSLRWICSYYRGGTKDDIEVVLHRCKKDESNKYSNGEQLLYATLNACGVEYTPQCYVPEINKYYDAAATINNRLIFIEFDGEQHFKPVANWGFEKTVVSDKEKNEYALLHQIPLIRIRYDQILLIPEIIDNLCKGKLNLMRLNPYLTDAEYYKVLDTKKAPDR